MSDDIERLKTVLEQLQRVNDTLQDDHDAMRDVVNVVKPVELETDPEGHAALRDLANEINAEVTRFGAFHYSNLLNLNRLLREKARTA